MKMTRRDVLRVAGGIGMFSLAAAKRCSAQSSNEAEHVATSVMQFYKLNAEPLVKSSYPTHPRFDNGVAGQVVVITAHGLERVDWENRPEKNCWLLRLPELLYLNNKRFDHQVGMDWRKERETWLYTDCPLRNLSGSWRNREKMQLAPDVDKNVPTVGKMAGTVQSDSLGTHYTLSVTNTSDEIWKDVFFWICLSHYQSPIIGYRPHFRVGESWLPAQEMPFAQDHTYYPTPGMVNEYGRCAETRSEFRAAHIELSFPGVVCWNHTTKGPLLVCHYSEDAMAVGSNQLWPCTDLQLWFGDLAPGEQRSKTGHVLVAECNLKTFGEQADSIRERLDARLPERKSKGVG